MGGQLLNLPINIPWELIAVSPDMMDTQFCNKRFPFEWRSSLAISAFEPRLEDLPEGLCDKRLTYLKITCSITGYQPTKEETEAGYASFPNVPTERLDRIFEEYFACYGVLLNVAVFPHPATKEELTRTSIHFDPQGPPAPLLPNPFESGGARFKAVNEQNNRIVDIFPPGGDGQGELDLHHEMDVTLPSTPRVEAKLVHFNPAGVTMEAFKGNLLVGSQTAGPAQGQVHELAIEGEEIDRVVFKAPQNEASLLELSYYVKRQVPVDLQDFPHIIDFEPKVRDLYQAATETGEILTASVSGIKTDKSFAHTETTETGLSLAAGLVPGADKAGSTITGTLSHKWGETDQDSSTTQIDASRERRENQSTTTSISQMYNLLTGYHPGTNRAVFLMLPRPHTLQPTDHRTFVQGLRFIEGVQEYFLIVARPKDMEGICIEAFLETGHFPEDVEVQEPPVEYDESFEDFIVTADRGARIDESEASKYTVAAGWVVDRREEERLRRGWESGHPGMKDIRNNLPDDTPPSFVDNYNYRAISDSTVQVSGTVLGPFPGSSPFNRTFRVFTRSEQPKPSSTQPQVKIDRLLIASRGLCVCMKSGADGCPEVVPFATLPPIVLESSIVDESPITISPAVLTRAVSGQTRLPAVKELLRKIQTTMTTSGRLPRRYPVGEVGFLESDYFKERIRKVLPNDHLETQLTRVRGLPPAVVESLGGQRTVAEALDMDLASFARRTQLPIEEAVKARRRLLGLVPRLGDDGDHGPEPPDHQH